MFYTLIYNLCHNHKISSSEFDFYFQNSYIGEGNVYYEYFLAKLFMFHIDFIKTIQTQLQ